MHAYADGAVKINALQEKLVDSDMTGQRKHTEPLIWSMKQECGFSAVIYIFMALHSPDLLSTVFPLNSVLGTATGSC